MFRFQAIRAFRVARFSRGLATAVEQKLPATLHLKTGESFKGTSFGAPTSVFGETVFSTSITSCAHFVLLLLRQ
jgi:carbamoyl-phosphate synthase small subunit